MKDSIFKLFSCAESLGILDESYPGQERSFTINSNAKSVYARGRKKE